MERDKFTTRLMTSLKMHLFELQVNTPTFYNQSEEISNCPFVCIFERFNLIFYRKFSFKKPFSTNKTGLAISPCHSAKNHI